MKLKRIISGILAAGILACSVSAPGAAPFGSGLVIEAQAASEKPAVPTGFKVSSSSVGKVKLSWDKISGADGVVIYSASSKKGNYEKQVTVGKEKTSIKLADFKEGRTYYFKLRAYKLVNGKNVYSDYTSAKKVTVMSQNMKNLATMKKKAPLFASYVEWLTSGFPITYDLEVTGHVDDFELSEMVISGIGGVKRIIATIESEKKLAVKMYMDDGSENAMFIKDGKACVIMSEYKAAVYVDLKGADTKEITDPFEKINDTEIPDLSGSGIKVKSGKKKYNGTNYLYEQITFKGIDTEITTYADTKTKEVKYIIVKSGGQQAVYRFRKISHKVDESLFEIPKGYTVMDNVISGLYGL